MSATLRRITPAHNSRVDAAVPFQRSSAGNRASVTHAGEDTTPEQKELARLKQIRSTLEEIILLADAQERRPQTAAGQEPGKTALRAETHQLLSQIRAIIGSKDGRRHIIHGAHSSASQTQSANVGTAAETEKRRQRRSDPKRQRVHLRLSRPLVKVLVAFGKTGRDPGRITERSLWNDSIVQDAASLLGVDKPACADS